MVSSKYWFRFMPADALWTFAMACNVYLTFFHKYNSDQLRRLEWKYVVGCYGLPFIPAFLYFFIRTPARGRVYGSAFVRLLLLYNLTICPANSSSPTAMVLDLSKMGLPPNRHLLRPRLVGHLPHIRHLPPCRLDHIPKTTRTPSPEQPRASRYGNGHSHRLA